MLYALLRRGARARVFSLWGRFSGVFTYALWRFFSGHLALRGPGQFFGVSALYEKISKNSFCASIWDVPTETDGGMRKPHRHESLYTHTLK